jgi:hypothetical protein
MHMYETTTFLNVDLDIYSKSDLDPLVTALGKKVLVCYVGLDRRTYVAHIELASGNPKSADAAIRRFCVLIGALPKAARELWDTAKTREFNIGVQAATQPYSWEMALSCETVEAAAKLKARIGFTVYAPEVPKKIVRKKRASPRGQRAL